MEKGPLPLLLSFYFFPFSPMHSFLSSGKGARRGLIATEANPSKTTTGPGAEREKAQQRL